MIEEFSMSSGYEKRVADHNAACVIMSVYHGDKLEYLEKSISSIDTASIDRIYIGIDGPISTDIQHYLETIRSDKVFTYSFPSNRGLAYVLNDLITEALSSETKFEFFFRMDADDISVKSRFEKQINYLSENPHVSCFGTCAQIINERGEVIGNIKKRLNHDELISRLAFDSPFVHPSVVFRRSVLIDQLYPTDSIRFEDVAMWFSLAKKGFIFENLENRLIYYRVTDCTISRRRGLKKLYHELCVRRNIACHFKGRFGISMLMIYLIFITKLILPPAVIKILLLAK